MAGGMEGILKVPDYDETEVKDALGFDDVELDDLVFCAQLVKDLLGLDAEGSGSKRVHDGRRVRNLRFELRLDCGRVVVARLD